MQWTTPRSETDAWTTPVLYAPPGQPPQIVTAGGGQFGGHAVESGERLWTHKGMAPAMVASPVVTGDTVVGFGYGYDSTPPFAEALTKSDTDGDGRLSVAECGTSAWLIGIAKYYGNRDGFIVESEWLAAHAAVDGAVEPGRRVAGQGRGRRRQRRASCGATRRASSPSCRRRWSSTGWSTRSRTAASSPCCAPTPARS